MADCKYRKQGKFLRSHLLEKTKDLFSIWFHIDTELFGFPLNFRSISQ